MKPIALITSNKFKIEEYDLLLLNRVSYVTIKINQDELQASQVEVVKDKAKNAALLYGGPVIVDDEGIFIDCLGGMPGAYLKDFYESVKFTGIYQMTEFSENKKASQTVSCCYCSGPGADPIVFQQSIRGQVKPPNPNLKMQTAIFAADCDEGLIQYQLDEQGRKEYRIQTSARGKAVEKLLEYLKQNGIIN